MNLCSIFFFNTSDYVEYESINGTLRSVFQRSGEWINEDTLFTSGLSVCPLNAKVLHLNFEGNLISLVRGWI